MNLEDHIAEYRNFPQKGVLFRDFGPVLREPSAMSYIADEFERHFHKNDVDVLAGIESRGFVVAGILAARYGKGMVMLRKAGKLPGRTAKLSYSTEYGKDSMELQRDALRPGERALICDDLLATGGTAGAAMRLVEKVGGAVAGFAFVVELVELGGRGRLAGHDCKSLVEY